MSHSIQWRSSLLSYGTLLGTVSSLTGLSMISGCRGIAINGFQPSPIISSGVGCLQLILISCSFAPSQSCPCSPTRPARLLTLLIEAVEVRFTLVRQPNLPLSSLQFVMSRLMSFPPAVDDRQSELHLSRLRSTHRTANYLRQEELQLPRALDTWHAVRSICFCICIKWAPSISIMGAVSVSSVVSSLTSCKQSDDTGRRLSANLFATNSL
ncbi:hypothetical protein SODALDRAFT_99473 [Sodiomyces alkalinus F11]|uniref:Uncharacterized protein n=1 Tax=Sodiomyces alkalinus (strain CBS 110278 / VKM F-3762 / F11) TaxID=1314773 RepID=A0A3N2Q1D4_SODAK|nr:hypothetical protein SODALDRAFT_99473 [Sodiomyces alkalinus F11]ROT40567.1 hypothetical protein SODALDRAFT_99473 [Sodiomyces alkalinus F11]